MNSRLPIVAVGFALAAGPVFAQPAPKPATPAPATQAPATPPTVSQPPRPFPEGAKVAYIDVQRIASESADGKAASAKLDPFRKKLDDLRSQKEKEIADKQKALEAFQQKRAQAESVVSDSVRQQQAADEQRMQLEIQRLAEDARLQLSQLQTEAEGLQRQLQEDFQRKVLGLCEKLRAEKNLHFILSLREAGLMAWDSGLDITADVIRRLDAEAGAPAPPKK